MARGDVPGSGMAAARPPAIVAVQPRSHEGAVDTWQEGRQEATAGDDRFAHYSICGVEVRLDRQDEPDVTP